jgi:hypothetical protein
MKRITKILNKYFVKNRKNHYCFKYSKKYLRQLSEEEDFEKIEKVIKYLDYPWSKTIYTFYKKNRKPQLVLLTYISYCRLRGFQNFTYKDSKIWCEWLDPFHQ